MFSITLKGLSILNSSQYVFLHVTPICVVNVWLTQSV